MKFFLLLLCLVAIVLPVSAQKIPSVTTAKTARTGNRSIILVPPSGYAYLSDQSLVEEMTHLLEGNNERQALLFCLRTQDVPAVGEMIQRPIPYAYATVPPEASGRHTKPKDFNRFKRAMVQRYTQGFAKALPEAKKIMKRQEKEIIEDYGIKLDNNKASFHNLGITDQGTFHITTGLVKKNAEVAGSGYSYTTNYVIFSTTVLVRDRIISMTLGGPYAKQSEIDGYKVASKKWVLDTIKRNKP